MGVEMSNIYISEMKNGVIRGWFKMFHYKYIRIEFECKNGIISFDYDYEDEEELNSLSNWLLREKALYESFILNYLNEIHRINKLTSFKGKLLEEYSYSPSIKEYVSSVTYNALPGMVHFKFYPSDGDFHLLYRIPIPINSDGEYASVIHMEDVLDYETIQRMWEPFRDKTKYRLQLLHMLR